MEFLTLTVRPEQAGRAPESLLRRELSMTTGQVSAVKFRPINRLDVGDRRPNDRREGQLPP